MKLLLPLVAMSVTLPMTAVAMTICFSPETRKEAQPNTRMMEWFAPAADGCPEQSDYLVKSHKNEIKRLAKAAKISKNRDLRKVNGEKINKLKTEIESLTYTRVQTSAGTCVLAMNSETSHTLRCESGLSRAQLAEEIVKSNLLETNQDLRGYVARLNLNGEVEKAKEKLKAGENLEIDFFNNMLPRQQAADQDIDGAGAAQ